MSRFFQQTSTWYTAIPSGHPVSANSNSICNRVAAESVLWISATEWAVPLYYAVASDPTYTVTVRTTDLSRQVILDNGYNLNVPIPPGTMPAGGEAYQSGQYRDAHCVIFSPDAQSCWDFYLFRPWNSPPSADRIRKWQLSGDGIVGPLQTVANSATCRAGGTPLLHGLVTYSEMQAGLIDHALLFCYGGGARRNTYGVYPCQRDPNNPIGFSPTNDGDDPFDPLMGMRFQLKPSININNLGLSAAGVVIARALQTYGMIFAENNGPGNNSIFFENVVYDPGLSWSSLGITSSTVISLGLSSTNFQVVEPVYPPAQVFPAAPTGLRVTNV